MYRNPLDLFRLFLSLFQDLPRMSRSVYAPGAVLFLVYPYLTVLLGPGREGEALVTAFMAALSIRVGLGFEGMVRRMLTRYSQAVTTLMALAFAVLPFVLLAFAVDPLSCQRLQSAFYLLIGALFLSDVLKGHVATAASFWPDPSMRDYLPGLTRVMVIYNLSFLLLNETMIQLVAPSTWLMFWAVLPVLGHMIVRALVLTVINLADDGQPV